MNLSQYDAWPALNAEDFKKTSHLLFMGVQIVGKLMLKQPFEPHWANLAMPLTSRGITTGIIPYEKGTFTVDFDFIDHQIIFTSSWGKIDAINLMSMSVAELTNQIFKSLKNIDVDTSINLKPQETSNVIEFNKDIAPSYYDGDVVNAWWRIMLSTERVLLKFHSRFYGISPRIGLLWGTLDLRDARYKGVHLPISDEMNNYIARNAFDDEQFEVGFSANNEKYPIPSFFAFVYPKPEGYELSKVKPGAAKWVPAVNEFVLDYDDLRKSKDPEKELLTFFESCYAIFAKLAHWDENLVVTGEPI